MGTVPTKRTAFRKANSPPGRTQILEAQIFQWGSSSSQKVSVASLNAIVLEESLPKISAETISEEPDGRFIASL